MRLSQSAAPSTIATTCPQVPAALVRWPDRFLDPDELDSLVHALGADSAVAALTSSLQPGDGARQWTMLHRDANVDVWLIVWNGGADTGWHDHDRSAGAFYVVAGRVVESRPSALGGQERLLRLDAGSGASFGPDQVHRVRAAAGRSVTVHAYSPPLQRMGRYTIDADGALRWHGVGYDEGLEVG